ncbi:MAG TPA: NAD-dependent epimerase/dehydratase family protein [Abditibacterium sp.]|jgi:UDP-glucose 4-epimerase
MKILVSGGAGFIGSHVVDAFLEDGNEVAVVDNLETGSRENVPSAAHFGLIDLRDAQKLRDFVLDFAPDAVFHHAAQISVPASVSDPAFDAQVNIVGSLNLWQSARDAGASRFVFASSGGAIYGDNPNLPLSEREIPAPTSPYGLSKQVFEMYLAQMARFGGPTPVILRYANVYGPRQGARGEAGVISIWARLLLENQLCTIYGDGTATRDYVFVGDVVAANRAALSRGDGGAWNIATTTQTSALELFQMLREKVGCGPQTPIFAPPRAGDIQFSCLDASAARQALGWSPQIALSEGLEKTVADLMS